MYNQTYNKILNQLGLTEEPRRVLNLCLTLNIADSRIIDNDVSINCHYLEKLAQVVQAHRDVWTCSTTRLSIEDRTHSEITINAVMIRSKNKDFHSSKVEILILHQFEIELCTITENLITTLGKIDSIDNLPLPKEVRRFILGILRVPGHLRKEAYQDINHDIESDLYNHDSDAYSGKFLSNALSMVSGNDIGLSVDASIILSELYALYPLLHDIDTACHVIDSQIAKNIPISLHIHGPAHAVVGSKYEILLDWYHDMQRFLWRNRKATNGAYFGNALHLTLDCLTARLEEDIATCKDARSAPTMAMKYLCTLCIRLLTQWTITTLWWDHTGKEVCIYDIQDYLEQKVSTDEFKI